MPLKPILGFATGLEIDIIFLMPLDPKDCCRWILRRLLLNLLKWKRQQRTTLRYSDVRNYILGTLLLNVLKWKRQQRKTLSYSVVRSYILGGLLLNALKWKRQQWTTLRYLNVRNYFIHPVYYVTPHLRMSSRYKIYTTFMRQNLIWEDIVHIWCIE